MESNLSVKGQPIVSLLDFLKLDLNSTHKFSEIVYRRKNVSSISMEEREIKISN